MYRQRLPSRLKLSVATPLSPCARRKREGRNDASYRFLTVILLHSRKCACGARRFPCTVHLHYCLQKGRKKKTEKRGKDTAHRAHPLPSVNGAVACDQSGHTYIRTCNGVSGQGSHLWRNVHCTAIGMTTTLSRFCNGQESPRMHCCVSKLSRPQRIQSHCLLLSTLPLPPTCSWL